MLYELNKKLHILSFSENQKPLRTFLTHPPSTHGQWCSGPVVKPDSARLDRKHASGSAANLAGGELSGRGEDIYKIPTT